MAEPEHDDLSEALARMADADFPTAASEPSASPLPPDAKVAKPVTRPATARPASEKSLVTITKPASTEGAVPTARPASPTRSARPAAPSVPNATPAAPPSAQPPVILPPAARRLRPAAPTTRTIVPADEAELVGNPSNGLTGEAGSALIDDDDAVIVPAPDPSVFQYRPKTSSSAREKIARQKSIDFRRTLIPILLTVGVLLIASTSLKFLGGPDSFLSDLPVWLLAVLVLLALVFLGLAAVNMISVKKALEQKDLPS